MDFSQTSRFSWSLRTITKSRCSLRGMQLDFVIASLIPCGELPFGQCWTAKGCLHMFLLLLPLPRLLVFLSPFLHHVPFPFSAMRSSPFFWDWPSHMVEPIGECACRVHQKSEFKSFVKSYCKSTKSHSPPIQTQLNRQLNRHFG